MCVCVMIINKSRGIRGKYSKCVCVCVHVRVRVCVVWSIAFMVGKINMHSCVNIWKFNR